MASWTTELQMRLLLWRQKFSPQTRDCDICRFPFCVSVGFFCQLHQEHSHLRRREKQFYINCVTTWILHGVTLWTCISDQKWSLSPNVLPEVVASHIFLSTDMAELIAKADYRDCESTAENHWTSVNSASPGLSRVLEFPNIFQWDRHKVKIFETWSLIMAPLEWHVKWVLPLK